jgi:hypothetical protein
MKAPIIFVAFSVVAVIAAFFLLGPLIPAVVIALAMTASIITSHTRRATLTALALLWLSSTILAGWLWRIGFQRADANLPVPPWTDLWLPLAVVSTGAVVAFFGFYVIQGREVRNHRD